MTAQERATRLAAELAKTIFDALREVRSVPEIGPAEENCRRAFAEIFADAFCAAIEEEREACARVAEECLSRCWPLEPRADEAIDIAAAIRARGEPPPAPIGEGQ